MKAGKAEKSVVTRVDQPVSNGKVEAPNLDFGTYHHSTPEESRDIRVHAEAAFSKLLQPLYPSGAALQILDAGCGLGFLMSVAAKCFPNAHITGVDLFAHGSMSEMSIERATNIMRDLRIGARTSFLEHDLTKPLPVETKYDLVVSNLVFHNMGKKRFKAYGTVFDAIKPGGYFVLGDLFKPDNTDLKYLREHATLINELDQGKAKPWIYKLYVLKKDA